MRRFAPVLAASLLALAACEGEPTPVICDPMLRDARASLGIGAPGPRRTTFAPPTAMTVTVLDSLTGRNLSAGARGTWVSGTQADSLYYDGGDRLTAYGPAGRYALVVQHAGYAAWGTDDVRVSAGECGPRTVQLTARLRPLGGQP
jgi:hypothetical protein